jgi:NAD-dependent dihydropyrimidine dehydrogenase PreA subunit
MLREIVHIDEELCDGCGDCVPECHEGALRIIDGKAVLLSDLACDGLGACLGHCPMGAITIEKREAVPYNEVAVMRDVIKKGKNVVQAHLAHLWDHKQYKFVEQGVAWLEDNGFPVPNYKGESEEVNKPKQEVKKESGMGCPGSASQAFDNESESVGAGDTSGQRPSTLTHWPIQLHLASPHAPHYEKSDLLLAADCAAFSHGDFHKDYMTDKTLAIACPKLDEGLESYIEKLAVMIDEAHLNTITVATMQVPCCNGLLSIAQEAASRATRKIPLKLIVLSLQGDVLREEWV